MDKDLKALKLSAIMAVFSMIAIMITLTTATFAWFTFSASTNVEPMSSTISKGDSELLISNSKDGSFGVSTELILINEIEQMKPVSTADLEHFYVATAQNKSGISVLYKEETAPDECLMHGTVYLKSIYGNNDVYLYEQALKVGGNPQVNSALRLALKITSKAGDYQYIFDLDSLVKDDTDAQTTTLKKGSVVESITGDGQGSLISDPSLPIRDYFVNDTEDGYSAGKNKLFYIEQDEIATVEYWLYLEGCDENCLNSVQASDVSLALAFAGVTAGKAK